MKLLDLLADRLGIESAFRDARGKMQRTSDDTKRALLKAIGLDGDEESLKKALDDLDRAAWQAPLPPACVIDGAGTSSVEVALPVGSGEIVWRIALEDGSQRDGRARFAKLPLEDSFAGSGRRLERRRLALPADLPWGYHTLHLQPGDAQSLLIVTPGRCWLPDALEKGRRLWGVSAQLYLLRSRRDWGIGDFGDLRRLVEQVAQHGADVVGLNPLHTMFVDNPEHASPYSPLSRRLLNVLNIDVAAVPELESCEAVRQRLASDEFRRELDRLRAAPLVDYTGVTHLKLQVLEELHRAFTSAAAPERQRAYEAFRSELGETLERDCLFIALREHFAAQDPALADWHAWPQPYQDHRSAEVAAFAREHHDRIDFHRWTQWIADTQLADAARAAQSMAIGLYRDLAVGADRSGAETWANPAVVVSGAHVGAPPDVYNPAGQDWGLPPFHPHALRAEAFRSFIQLVRANMRHAGGLRIDHVMALQHLYWVPQGQRPVDGAYVEYPMRELIGILALESHRHRCLVVGEDLGTVPEGFRERMAQANILSYRVLFFEQNEQGMLPPESYPSLALAVAGSHDLPTLRAWWSGSDITLRERLGLFPDADGPEKARRERERDRGRLLDALRREALIDAARTDLDIDLLIYAAHAFLSKSPAAIAVVQIDDLTREEDPVNVPATSLEHPNWRRKLSVELEELDEKSALPWLAEVLRRERGRS